MFIVEKATYGQSRSLCLAVFLCLVVVPAAMA